MVVINRSIRNAVVPFVAMSSLVALDSCKEEEVGPTPKYTDAQLIGDWQVTDIGDYSYDDTNYQTLFKFDANKDFTICTSVTYGGSTYSYCDQDYDYKWKWQDASNSSIVISEPDEDDIIADVVLLNDTNMELDVNYDGANEIYKFIKVN